MSKTWVAGEEITAEKLNQVNRDTEPRLSQIEHNVLELYLENYFASKVTPSNGIFFDGFSDTAKICGGVGTMPSGATAGNNYVSLNSDAELATFLVGQKVSIYDTTYLEEKTILSKAINATDATLADWAYTTGANFSDAGVVSSKRKINWVGPTSGLGASTAKLTKTFSVVAGVQYNLLLATIIGDNFGTQAGWKIEVYADGTQIYTSGNTLPNTFNTNVNFTPAGSTTVIEIRCSWVLSGSGNWSSSNGSFQMSGFDLNMGKKLFLTANLSNSYASGGHVKRLTSVINTTNKILSMDTDVGNGLKTVLVSTRNVFTQLMDQATLWIQRSISYSKTLGVSLALGATTLSIPVGYGISTPELNEQFSSLDTSKWTSTAGSVAGEVVMTDTQYISSVGKYTVNRARQIIEFKMRKNITNDGGIDLYLGDGTNYINIAQKTINGAGIFVTTGGAFGSNSYTLYGNPTSGTFEYRITLNGTSLKVEVGNTLATILATYNLTLSASVASYTMYFKFSYYSSGVGYVDYLKVYDAGVTYSSISSGDIMDIYTVDKTIRERKTISSATLNGSNYDLVFTPAVAKSGGFSSSDFIERVDTKPKASIVDTGAEEVFEDMTFVKSVDILNGSTVFTEDEYIYQPTTPNTDFSVWLETTRKNKILTPTVKQYGVSLSA